MADGFPGCLLSVALSLTSRPVDVIHHPVLWCPDFPPARFLRTAPAITRPSLGNFILLGAQGERSGCNRVRAIIELLVPPKSEEKSMATSTISIEVDSDAAQA